MKSADPTVHLVFKYPIATSIVWNAITKQNEMIQWFFKDIPAFNAELGFETSFIVKPNERSFTHRWKVTEVISKHKIVYTWSYDEYDGDGYVVFELVEKEGETQLNFSFAVTEDFPDGIPEFNRESCIGGWNFFLGEQLKAYLNGEETNGV